MGKCEKWTVCYRPRKGNTVLPEDLNSPFTPIPNSLRYWRADPFVVEDGDKTWLFAELFDRPRLKGVLGCCELTANGAGKWRIILDEPFHLSYPFVFRQEGQWYIIPESLDAGRILLYRATMFPWKWEQVRELSQIDAVDTTLVQNENGSFLITIAVENQTGKLAVLKADAPLTHAEPLSISDWEDPNTRPAGRAFMKDGAIVRPSQDCTRGYGYGLNFMKILRLDVDGLQEEPLCKILPKDITITGIPKPEGIHTYNFTSAYEVIDCKEYEFGLLSKIGGVIRRIQTHLRKT